MSTRTLYLVDGYDDGHHQTHHRNYARAALDMGYRVVELLPEPAPLQRWLEAQRPDAMSRLRLHRFTHPQPTSPSWRLRNVIKPAKTWRAAAAAVAQAEARTGWKPDLVFFNWLDSFIVGVSPVLPPVLPVLFPYRWSGVFFHPWHLRIPDGPTRGESVASERMLRAHGCPGVAVLDGGIAQALEANIGKPVVTIPDETDPDMPDVPSALAQQAKAAADGRRIIGLMGVLSKRKGVISLLAAALQARDRPWFFVFAGVLDEGLRATYNAEELAVIDAAIGGAYPNVWFHPSRIADEREFNAIVQACDVLFAAYELFAHSSGIVTKAGIFEKPVIVSPGYCMAEVVQDYRLGLATDPHDPAQVLQAIELVLDRAAFARRIGQPDYARFQRDYASDALGSAFGRILDLCR
jgi:glycosyltransferase involved in cell wall biosynthesis